jgi:hypothetical protein
MPFDLFIYIRVMTVFVKMKFQVFRVGAKTGKGADQAANAAPG